MAIVTTGMHGVVVYVQKREENSMHTRLRNMFTFSALVPDPTQYTRRIF